MRGSEPTTTGDSLPLDRLFAAFGQVLLLLDPEFRVVATAGALAGGDHRFAGGLTGSAAPEIFGGGLFGPRGALRLALTAGARREGWRTTLQAGGDRPRLVSLTAAPLAPEIAAAAGDSEAAYALLVRPVTAGAAVASTGPVVFCGMAARSAAMLGVFRLIDDLADSTATVLITGASGTGKELVARAFHQRSSRRDGPFVAVSCAGLPDSLIESELFGHARGSFTGAVQHRVGRFEAADGGTLLLDEIGDIPPHVQVKLLRVLQERAVERLGENRPRRFDARILAATHVDLKAAVREGRFREDLYYRLRVVSCHLPPLRERPEDLESLATYLLARAAGRDGSRRSLSPETLGVLLRYSWPGNVRELENALEHAAAVGRSPVVEPEDLPQEILLEVSETEAAPPPEAAGAARGGGLAGAAAGVDRHALRAALETNRWRRRETAQALGISRTSLWRRMRDLDLLG
jgi:DNA-binding NtrC family response regulator